VSRTGLYPRLPRGKALQRLACSGDRSGPTQGWRDGRSPDRVPRTGLGRVRVGAPRPALTQPVASIQVSGRSPSGNRHRRTDHGCQTAHPGEAGSHMAARTRSARPSRGTRKDPGRAVGATPRRPGGHRRQAGDRGSTARPGGASASRPAHRPRRRDAVADAAGQADGVRRGEPGKMSALWPGRTGLDPVVGNRATKGLPVAMTPARRSTRSGRRPGHRSVKLGLDRGTDGGTFGVASHRGAICSVNPGLGRGPISMVARLRVTTRQADPAVRVFARKAHPRRPSGHYGHGSRAASGESLAAGPADDA